MWVKIHNLKIISLLKCIFYEQHVIILVHEFALRSALQYLSTCSMIVVGPSFS